MKLPKSKTKRGQYFEAIAANFLQNTGFTILSQNYRNLHKEIDIICKKDSVIHFVEVKGRTSNVFGEITETITHKKKQNLIIAANVWMRKNGGYDQDWQIDFLGIEMKNNDKDKITFLENAINQL